MSRLSRLLTRSGRPGYRSHMNLIIDQPRSSQRKRRKLDRGSETSRISYVVSLLHSLTGTLAQTIYEMPSCILAVKSEIVAQVNDPALWLDLMAVDELTRNAMAEAQEYHIRIIQLLSETNVCLTDQIPMYRSYGSSFRRSGCRRNYLYIRVIQ